jgi:hypothetical protein
MTLQPPDDLKVSAKMLPKVKHSQLIQKANYTIQRLGSAKTPNQKSGALE